MRRGARTHGAGQQPPPAAEPPKGAPPCTTTPRTAPASPPPRPAARREEQRTTAASPTRTPLPTEDRCPLTTSSGSLTTQRPSTSRTSCNPPRRAPAAPRESRMPDVRLTPAPHPRCRHARQRPPGRGSVAEHIGEVGGVTGQGGPQRVGDGGWECGHEGSPGRGPQGDRWPIVVGAVATTSSSCRSTPMGGVAGQQAAGLDAASRELLSP